MSPENNTLFLDQLCLRIRKRLEKGKEQSYIAQLKQKGSDAVLKKIGEEAAEVIIAAAKDDPKQHIHESADLLFHLLVLLEMQGLGLDPVVDELKRRFNQSEHSEEPC